MQRRLHSARARSKPTRVTKTKFDTKEVPPYKDIRKLNANQKVKRHETLIPNGPTSLSSPNCRVSKVDKVRHDLLGGHLFLYG